MLLKILNFYSITIYTNYLRICKKKLEKLYTTSISHSCYGELTLASSSQMMSTWLVCSISTPILCIRMNFRQIGHIRPRSRWGFLTHQFSRQGLQLWSCPQLSVTCSARGICSSQITQLTYGIGKWSNLCPTKLP